jgi:capsular exopolysaccharide synthesis family protein
MINNNPKQYPDSNNQLLVRNDQQQNLPSVEVREVVPEFKDEIDLRDLLDVLIRRKWIVISTLIFIFFTVALITFAMTPQFKARGSMKVSAQSSNLTKFDSLEGNALKTMEFQQTQVKLLQSEQLALRVIELLELSQSIVFNPNAGDKASETGAHGLLASIKNFVRADESTDSISILSDDAKQQILLDKILTSFETRFKVSPVRNSELIEVSFETPDPSLSAEIANAAMDEFINMHMDGSMQRSRDASRFLGKQIQAAQIKLEKSEIELQKFARKIGVVSLDPKLNMVYRQMEEFNEALAKARSAKISAEARYEQVNEMDLKEFAQLSQSSLVQDLRSKYAILKSEYEDLGITFKPEFPKMLKIKARMEELIKRVEAEKKNIINAIKTDFKTAVRTEEDLAEQAELQKQRALDLEEKATQYKIYEREVESSKNIYQSLLERSKEIEATVGAAVTNIQIIDRARPPLFPYKPRVALNLLLGIVLGLFSGVGVAFLFEYFDNTIKSPDEMVDRFHIPVLGLIPYAKEAVDDRKNMALKFFQDPRSPVAEAFRTTMTSVRLSVADDPPKVILITSVLPGAGKSSLSSNACLSYLAEDETCLLIDCDLRKPSLHRIFKNGEKGKGLSSVLSGMSKLTDVISKTEFDGLDFISSGPLPPNPAEMLSSKRMRQLLNLATNKYDKVILDGPPYQGFAEILVLANMVDGVILIAVEGDTPREGVRHFRKALTNVGGRILGAIINKSGKKKGFGYGSYGGYKYYAYNYEYGKES